MKNAAYAATHRQATQQQLAEEAVPRGGARGHAHQPGRQALDVTAFRHQVGVTAGAAQQA
eukprot:360627-Chlamydomonas_euryale.AAC.3